MEGGHSPLATHQRASANERSVPSTPNVTALRGPFGAEHSPSVPSTPNVTALRGPFGAGMSPSSPRTPVLRSAANAAAFSSPVHTPCLASSGDALRSQGARSPVLPVSELSLENDAGAWDGPTDWRYEFDAPRFEDFMRPHYREAKDALDAIVYGGDVSARAAWTDLTLVLAESDAHYAWFQRPHAEHEPSTPATPAGPLISPAGIASSPAAHSTPRSPQSPSVRRANRSGSPATPGLRSSSRSLRSSPPGARSSLQGARSSPQRPATSPRTPLWRTHVAPLAARPSHEQTPAARKVSAAAPLLGRVLEAHVRPVDSPARSSSSIERAMGMAAMGLSSVGLSSVGLSSVGLSSVSSAGAPHTQRHAPTESDADVRPGTFQVCGLGDDSGTEDAHRAAEGNVVGHRAAEGSTLAHREVEGLTFAHRAAEGLTFAPTRRSPGDAQPRIRVSLAQYTPQKNRPAEGHVSSLASSPCMPVLESAALGMIATPVLRPAGAARPSALADSSAVPDSPGTATPSGPRIKKARASHVPPEPNENVRRPEARVNPPRDVRVNAARIDDLRRMLAEHNERLRGQPRVRRR